MNDYTRITPDPLSSPNNNRRNLLIGGGCLLLFMCLACAGLIVGISGYMVYLNYGEELTAVSATQEPQVPITPSPEQLTVATRITPSPLPTFTNTPSATHDTALADPALTPETTEPPTHTAVPSLNLPVPPEINQTAVPANAQTYLDQLYQTEYPSHDYYQTAQHLGEHNPPPTLDPPPGPYQIGDNHTFFNDTDAVNATLLAITDHAYFWVEDELNLDQTDVAEAANQFENEYYDRLIHLFGQVWDPGIDNDPHISVLHISNSAADELGYFNSEDEYISDLFEYSNEQEIIYLNMGELNLGDDLYYATLVHETQHLIQWYVDPSESVWLNEGLSQLAEVYLGFTDTAETIDYLQNPATQLNKWNYDEDEVYAHYAAAFLFSVYLWEQLGETAVQELSRHPANGLAAVYAILQGYAPEEMTLETFSANWAAANFLDDSQAAPQYYYRNLDFRQPSFQHEVEENTPFEVTESLNQFGVHYIDLRDLHGETTITFAADTATSLIDTPAREDEIFWYAPAVNEMDAYLTAGFDLTAVNQANLG
ncbi:MAG: hypothetical protein GY796_02075, partial [Chloroflexi bacterium]|nr:hypothetical protein [Chloroflexota bacterium]